MPSLAFQAPFNPRAGRVKRPCASRAPNRRGQVRTFRATCHDERLQHQRGLLVRLPRIAVDVLLPIARLPGRGVLFHLAREFQGLLHGELGRQEAAGAVAVKACCQPRQRPRVQACAADHQFLAISSGMGKRTDLRGKHPIASSNAPATWAQAVLRFLCSARTGRPWPTADRAARRPSVAVGVICSSSIALP
jgi:hypothetical protein